jgi:hypothetical protein
MEAWNLADPQIEFVFGRVDDALKAELQAFWLKHQGAYQSEIKAFRALSDRELTPLSLLPRPLRRQPATIARSAAGEVIGIIFVVLRELEPSLDLGSHAYFLRIYVLPSERKCKLTNRLFKAFLNGFDDDPQRRDYRAKILIAENVNPGLQQAFMRRYFARLGFRMLGSNNLGGEVWTRKLQTSFVF